MEEMMGIDDEKVIGIKLESCSSEISNNSRIAMQPEVMASLINNSDNLMLQGGSDYKTNITTDNVKQSVDQTQNIIDVVQVKHEIDSDSDIEVDLAYRIIDTFNVCEVESFKQEGESISSDTETSLKIELPNDEKQTQIKVEGDNNTDILKDLDYREDNNLNACEKKIVIMNENEDYINIEDDVNKTPVQRLQIKGM